MYSSVWEEQQALKYICFNIFAYDIRNRLRDNCDRSPEARDHALTLSSRLVSTISSNLDSISDNSQNRS